MDKTDNQETISALADGELQGDAFVRAVVLATQDGQGRAAWHAYQVIGEVLRTGQAAPGSAPDAFLERLQQRLKDEPAPRVMPLPFPPASLPAVARVGEAANDGRWKLLAGVASMAAVAALGWNLLGASAPAAGPQLAAAPQPTAVAAAATPRADQMIRDPRLDQFLAAHRQLGGATALQNTSGFLRNATFEGAAR